MGETTIEWCDFTFNPWIGCSKVSAACKNCYAEVETFTRVQRSRGRELWGVDAERHITSDENWGKPAKWNKAAQTAGERRRVFCASLADVFEDRPDLLKPRLRLFDTIINTPHLDWLLLTKRPESILPILRASLALCAECQSEHAAEKCGDVYRWLKAWLENAPPANVSLGTTAENQDAANQRVPELLRVAARVHFVSCEPLLGPIDLHSIIALDGDGPDLNLYWIGQDARIDWVICGGESGSGARPMSHEWARSLRDQCSAAKVPFLFKQWGEYHPQWCDGQEPLGKKRAGRILDGRTWDEFPVSQVSA